MIKKYLFLTGGLLSVLVGGVFAEYSLLYIGYSLWASAAVLLFCAMALALDGK